MKKRDWKTGKDWAVDSVKRDILDITDLKTRDTAALEKGTV
jgi:hypothetical protein